MDLVSSVCGNIAMQVKGIEQDESHVFGEDAFLHLGENKSTIFL